jgi:membrane protease YdiL (CAAX protease family)
MNAPCAANSPPAETQRRSASPLTYFALTFAISWAGALALVAPRLLRGESIPMFTGLMMFPVMLLGPALSGIALTVKASGVSGIRALFGRMATPFLARWLGVLLVPPALIATVLGFFAVAVSRVYSPNNFFIGFAFGALAGFVEEVGWTGYAFPALQRKLNPFRAAIILGLLWSLWHMPVVDYLGTVTPHRSYWAAYFLAFAAVMTAMRVIICWVYDNTGSLLMAQLLHVFSTGSLVVLSPSRVTAGQEALWYLAYAGTLWIFVLVVHRICRVGSAASQFGLAIDPGHTSKLSGVHRSRLN